MTDITRNTKHETRNTDPLLRIESLSCQRGGRTLFSDFALSVGPSEAVQLAGGNGRGKTTLLRTLSGLQRPAAGRVSWNGRCVHAEDGYRGNLLYLAHENALNPDLTPRENLAALTRLQAGRTNIDEALGMLGVRTHAGRLCRRLSAGQRRRSALARLPLSDARLWLLDEPAAALDAEGREALGRLIADHVADGGLVVFTTHEPLTLPGPSARTITL